MVDLKKVKSGDPLAIPAATFNTFVDAAQDFLRCQRSIARTPTADRPPFETVLLKNASGADRGRFDVLGIDGPLFDSASPAAPGQAAAYSVLETISPPLFGREYSPNGCELANCPGLYFRDKAIHAGFSVTRAGRCGHAPRR